MPWQNPLLGEADGLDLVSQLCHLLTVLFAKLFTFLGLDFCIF